MLGQSEKAILSNYRMRVRFTHPRAPVDIASEQPNSLHGVILSVMLEQLVTHHGWEEMGGNSSRQSPCFLFKKIFHDH